MWPISCAMRPSRRPDSTARTDTNSVCEESFDFVAPMIAIETISADTGQTTRRPCSAYFAATSSKAPFTLRVPPRPERSTTAVSTAGPREGSGKTFAGLRTCARNSQTTSGLEGVTFPGRETFRTKARKGPERRPSRRPRVSDRYPKPTQLRQLSLRARSESSTRSRRVRPADSGARRRPTDQDSEHPSSR